MLPRGRGKIAPQQIESPSLARTVLEAAGNHRRMAGAAGFGVSAAQSPDIPRASARGRASIRRQIALPWRGTVITVPSSSPSPRYADWRSSNPCLADALCRRSRPAVSKHDRDALTALRLAPARLTQSSTSFEVEDCEAARAYFFFRRLVFFAPFFAADFVFVFRFFAMLPS